MILPPETCRTMPELRAQIDALDQQIMGLLMRRVGYVDRAAEIKETKDLPARIDWRVEEVAKNARINAQKLGFDADLAESLWREMIEWSIAREAAKLEKETT